MKHPELKSEGSTAGDAIRPSVAFHPGSDRARHAEHFAESAFDVITANLCVLDRSGTIIAVNDAWRRFYDDNSPPGSDNGNYGVGRNYLNLCAVVTEDYADEAAQVAAGILAVIEGRSKRFSLEYACHTPDEARWFSLVVSAFSDASGHVLAAHENISERKLAQAALIEAREVAEAANRAKSDFLAVMSHEIRTPMNGILGMSELLLSPEISAAERIEFAQLILESSHNLLALLNDILDLAKVEAGQIVLERRTLSPCQLIADMHALFGESARHKGLKFFTEIHMEDEAAQFWGDPLRLRQILSNLTSNAIKFCTHGKVTLGLSTCLDAAGRESLHFAVSDTGIGIPEALRERLFKSFSQVDSSITRRFGGTGLGLAIVKNLVHLMDGEVGITSAPEQGSTFWFNIPLERVSVQHAASQPALPAAKPVRTRDDAHRWNILVVDDTLINCRLLAILLRKLGYWVGILSNGQMAVEEVTLGSPPDLILMDCHMPGMDGLEATRLIRAWEKDSARAKSIPIVAVTAGVSEQERMDCLAAGMDAFMSKPLDFHALDAVLRRLLPDASLPAHRTDSAKTAPRPAPEPPSSDAPINIAAALVRLDDDRDIYLDFAMAVPAQIAIDHAQIAVHANDEKPEKLRKASHRLKGVLAILGAERAAAACAALEAAAKHGDRGPRAPLLHELDAALSALAPALAKLLQAAAATPGAAGPASSAAGDNT